MMAEGIGDKMADDDWTHVLTRKSKARHKDIDDDSDGDRKTKRNKKDDKKQAKDKYQATRCMTEDNNNSNDEDVSHYGNTDGTNEASNTATQKQTGAKPKTDNLLKRQNKDNTDGTYNDGWIKNQHYTTFIIHKEMKDTDKSNEVKYPHPMEVAKMLKNIGVTKYKSMKSVGRGNFQISFEKPRDAEQLLNSKLLTENFGFSIFVPTRFKESIGVVGDVPPSITEQEVMENIVCENNIKVFKVERIKKRVGVDKFQPTYTIKIFVRGEILPNSVEIYGTPRYVEPYVFPLKICFKCWRFGHRDKFCKSKEVRCCKCGLNHNEKECEETELKCVNCSGQHKASDKECPERARQDLIRQDMATNKTSYFEASEKYPKKQKQDLQSRLDSVRDFPLLQDSNAPNTSNNIKQRKRIVNLKPHFITPQNSFNSQNTKHEFLPNPYKTTEIEKITQMIKEELIREFNLNKMFDKIKALQETIIKSTSKSDTITQDLLLINISNELNKIINPEVIPQQKD